MKHPSARHVVVKFVDSVTIAFDHSALIVSGDHVDPKPFHEFWKSLQYHFADVHIDRVFRAKSADRIDALVRIARSRNECYRPPKFGNYISLRLAGGSHKAELCKSLLAKSLQSPFVDTAYIRLDDVDAALQPELDPPRTSDDSEVFDPRSPLQRYLRPAPEGIGAEELWPLDGADGQGQIFIDIERGWDLGHEDLIGADRSQHVHFDDTAAGAAMNAGCVNLDTSMAHGTAVVGIVCAQNNDKGMIGLARNCHAQAVSYWNKSFNAAAGADAVMSALTEQLQTLLKYAQPEMAGLSAGITILIEAQAQLVAHPAYYFPVEVYPDMFHAIELATNAGATVIEPAGNGLILGRRGHPLAVDLDSYSNVFVSTDPSGSGLPKGNLLNCGDSDNPAFRDSGAIMVGAAESVFRSDPVIWKHRPYSNYGSRIDCFAAGRDVATTGWWKQARIDTAPPTPNAQYCADFNGTSAASAIIAGAAVSVQGIHRANRGDSLSPEQLRVVLSDVALGTATSDSAAASIGVMPNLPLIAKQWA